MLEGQKGDHIRIQSYLSNIGSDWQIKADSLKKKADSIQLEIDQLHAKIDSLQKQVNE